MNFFLRVLTSIVLLPVVIASIHFGGIAFLVLIALVGLLIADEIVSMGLGKGLQFKFLFAPVVAALLALVVFSPSAYCVLLVLWALLFYLGVLFTFKPGLPLAQATRMSLVVAVLLYAFLGLALVVSLRNGNFENADMGRSSIYLVMVCTFGNDTFAYLFGRWFGKHRLFEKVSQKKTWEGFFAGAIASVLLPFVFIQLFKVIGIDLFRGLSTADLLIVSIGISFLGPIGDLIESRIKRAFDVKDSGSLLPGHGGMFDRIDALLVTLPFTFAYAFFLRTLW